MRSSNGIGVLLRKQFHLGVKAVSPRAGPTSPPHEASRALLSSTEHMDDDVDDDDYICERCRDSRAIRTNNVFEQQRKIQPKDKNSEEEFETVSSTSNVTVNSANQILREIHISDSVRTLLGSSPDESRDTVGVQDNGTIMTTEALESKSGIPAGVADYDETLKEISETEKKGQEVGQWQSGGGQNIRRIFGGDAHLARRVSLGVELVDRTKKDAPDGSGTASSRPLKLCAIGDIDAVSNHGTTDGGGLAKQSRNSCYERDECRHERKCGNIVKRNIRKTKRNIGKTKRNNSGEAILKECKRETDGSRGRGEGPPPSAAALTPQDTEAFVEKGVRIGSGCGSGLWFLLELLETWAGFLVFSAFFVRQVRCNIRFFRVFLSVVIRFI